MDTVARLQHERNTLSKSIVVAATPANMTDAPGRKVPFRTPWGSPFVARLERAERDEEVDRNARLAAEWSPLDWLPERYHNLFKQAASAACIIVLVARSIPNEARRALTHLALMAPENPWEAVVKFVRGTRFLVVMLYTKTKQLLESGGLGFTFNLMKGLFLLELMARATDGHLSVRFRVGSRALSFSGQPPRCLECASHRQPEVERMSELIGPSTFLNESSLNYQDYDNTTMEATRLGPHMDAPRVVSTQAVAPAQNTSAHTYSDNCESITHSDSGSEGYAPQQQERVRARVQFAHSHNTSGSQGSVDESGVSTNSGAGVVPLRTAAGVPLYTPTSGVFIPERDSVGISSIEASDTTNNTTDAPIPPPLPKNLLTPPPSPLRIVPKAERKPLPAPETDFASQISSVMDARRRRISTAQFRREPSEEEIDTDSEEKENSEFNNNNNNNNSPRKHASESHVQRTYSSPLAYPLGPPPSQRENARALGSGTGASFKAAAVEAFLEKNSRRTSFLIRSPMSPLNDSAINASGHTYEDVAEKNTPICEVSRIQLSTDTTASFDESENNCSVGGASGGGECDGPSHHNDSVIAHMATPRAPGYGFELSAEVEEGEHVDLCDGSGSTVSGLPLYSQLSEHIGTKGRRLSSESFTALSQSMR